jgi:hypothetical protein
MKLGILKVGFGVTDQLQNQISFFLHSSDTGEKWEHNERVNQLFRDFKKTYDSG